MNKKISELCGAIHLHTTYSDGGVTLEELIKASQSVDLDYIVVTDHMSLGGLKDNFEGLRGKLNVIIGYEHNDQNCHNHYLAIGIQNVFDDISTPEEYINAIKNSGGIGFLAHPAEKRNYFGNLPPYPWTAWQAKGFDGIEIWNQMSDWVENIKSLTSVIKLLYPRRFIKSAPQELLQKWDDLNKNSFISGIGGVDAHSRKIGKGLFRITVFPIRVELKGIRTHVLFEQIENSNSFNDNKTAILKALKNGNCFISNYRRGDARGSKFYIIYKDGTICLPGKSNHYSLPAKIFVDLPENGSITLIKDGFPQKTISGKNATFDIYKTGIYRIEVSRKSNAWIYSNPFPIGTYPIL